MNVIKETILGNINQVTSNITEINKQAKEFSTDLDTAISILETSKQDIKQKIEKAQSAAATPAPAPAPKPDEGGA